MYQILLSPLFEKEFAKLEKRIQERVRKILKRLETQLIGLPLTADLKGFYSVHFENNKYRLIYHVKDKTVEVLVVHVGKRTTQFYQEFKRDYAKMIRKQAS